MFLLTNMHVHGTITRDTPIPGIVVAPAPIEEIVRYANRADPLTHFLNWRDREVAPSIGDDGLLGYIGGELYLAVPDLKATQHVKRPLTQEEIARGIPRNLPRELPKEQRTLHTRINRVPDGYLVTGPQVRIGVEDSHRGLRWNRSIDTVTQPRLYSLLGSRIHAVSASTAHGWAEELQQRDMLGGNTYKKSG